MNTVFYARKHSTEWPRLPRYLFQFNKNIKLTKSKPLSEREILQTTLRQNEKLIAFESFSNRIEMVSKHSLFNKYIPSVNAEKIHPADEDVVSIQTIGRANEKEMEEIFRALEMPPPISPLRYSSDEN